jgi:hypothetical protein
MLARSRQRTQEQGEDGLLPSLSLNILSVCVNFFESSIDRLEKGVFFFFFLLAHRPGCNGF